MNDLDQGIPIATRRAHGWTLGWFNDVLGTSTVGGELNIPRSQIGSTSIGPNKTFISSGFTTAGDLGIGAIYTSVGASPSGPMAIQDATGTWFQLVINSPANVGWFGAVGDGSTNDTAAFVSCYSVCAANGFEIYIPPGTYKVDALTWDQGVNVRGSGSFQTTFIPSGNNLTVVTFVGVSPDDRSRITEVGHFRVDGASASNIVGVHILNSNNNHLQDIAAVSCSDTGIHIEGGNFNLFDFFSGYSCGPDAGGIGIRITDDLTGTFGGGNNNQCNNFDCFGNDVGLMMGRTGNTFPFDSNTFINLVLQANELCALWAINMGSTVITTFVPEGNGQGVASSKVIKGETITKSAVQAISSAITFLEFSYSEAANIPVLAQMESRLEFIGMGGADIPAIADSSSLINMSGIPGNGAQLTNVKLKLAPGNPSAIGVTDSANLINDNSFPNLAPSPSAPPPMGASNCASTGFAIDANLGQVTTATFNAVAGDFTTNRIVMQYCDNNINPNDLVLISLLIKTNITGTFHVLISQGILDFGPFTLQAGVWTRVFGKVGNGLGIVLDNNMLIFPGDTNAATIQIARLTTVVNPTPIDAQTLSQEHRFNSRNNTDPILVIKTTDFTVGDSENWIINNKAGSTCIITLPDPTIILDRKIVINNRQAQAVASASANVVPLAGGGATVAILPATLGKWATLLSDGVNWQIIQGN
jgi:hypothetical protein